VTYVSLRINGAKQKGADSNESYDKDKTSLKSYPSGVAPSRCSYIGLYGSPSAFRPQPSLRAGRDYL